MKYLVIALVLLAASTASGLAQIGVALQEWEAKFGKPDGRGFYKAGGYALQISTADEGRVVQIYVRRTTGSKLTDDQRAGLVKSLGSATEVRKVHEVSEADGGTGLILAADPKRWKAEFERLAQEEERLAQEKARLAREQRQAEEEMERTKQMLANRRAQEAERLAREAERRAMEKVEAEKRLLRDQRLLAVLGRQLGSIEKANAEFENVEAGNYQVISVLVGGVLALPDQSTTVIMIEGTPRGLVDDQWISAYLLRRPTVTYQYQATSGALKTVAVARFIAPLQDIEPE